MQQHCIDSGHCARLEKVAADASHLAHMPAHIYCLVGDWTGAVRANAIAVEKDRKWVAHHAKRVDAGALPENMFTLYRCHNRHMLLYAAMFAAQVRGVPCTPQLLAPNSAANADSTEIFGAWQEEIAMEHAR